MMQARVLHASRIVIVDDMKTNVLLLAMILKRAGYDAVTSTTDPRETFGLCADLDPDLILLDLAMPHMDGYEVLARLRAERSDTTYLPILVLTADSTPEAKRRVLSHGATDFLTKPFDASEVIMRVGNLLETRSLHLAMEERNASLERQAQQRPVEPSVAVGREPAVEQLGLSGQETVQRLSAAAELRDDETPQHLRRMSDYCALLGQAIGESDRRCEVIGSASRLHDIGKLGIADQILFKPSPLTPQERLSMEQHAELGYRLLKGSTSELLDVAALIARTHHERIDGTGYPRGLQDDRIPLEGRIAAIADGFDRLTTDRIYRQAIPVDEAVWMLKQGSGTRFDALLLDHFLDSLDAVMRIKDANRDQVPMGRPPLSSELTAHTPVAPRTS